MMSDRKILLPLSTEFGFSLVETYLGVEFGSDVKSDVVEFP
jgi:hypothetical protein